MVRMAALPSGTVTFLFSDVEGSTQLLEQHRESMGAALARHLSIIEHVVQQNGGDVFETVGDASYAAFEKPSAALTAAAAIHRALAAESWGDVGRLAVRIAIHSGEVQRRGRHYFGEPLFRVARIQALAHGEQTLISDVTARLLAGQLPGDVRLRDLGTHRLKDLAEAEHVYQPEHPSLRTDFPALRSTARPHNLPIQLSSFVGRVSETNDVRHALREHRLVTLLGPGGIGKTRLALHAASTLLDEYDDGIFLIELAPLRAPELVAATISGVLGVREYPGERVDTTLTAYLASKEALLVLDNVEQLVPGVGLLLTHMLQAAPKLRVLVTGRRALHISGEYEYRVPTLSARVASPRPADLPDAAALFVERVRAFEPNLSIDAESRATIQRVCDRLANLPLAIELAAAGARIFSLEDLQERLDRGLPILGEAPMDFPARHQTLAAAISWSEELLGDADRQLFHRLGVFAGAFALESAVAISGQGDESAVAATMSRLIDHSLVKRVESTGPARYAMLEVVRDYAASQLERSGWAGDVRLAHARHFLELANSWHLYTGEGGTANIAEQFDQAADDLRAALTHAFGERLPFAADLALATRHYLAFRARFDEASRWTNEALRVTQHEATARRSEILRQAASISRVRRELRRARELAEEALTLARQLGDRSAIAQSVLALGKSAADEGDYTSATKLYAEAAELFDAQIDPRRVMWAEAIACLGDLALDEGRIDEAAAHVDRALSAFQSAGDLWGVAQVLTLRALAALALGERASAEASLLESLGLCQRLGFSSGVAINLEALGATIVDRDPAVGALLLGAAEAMRDRSGLLQPTAERRLHERAVAALGDRHLGATWATGHTSPELAIAIVLGGKLPPSG